MKKGKITPRLAKIPKFDPLEISIDILPDSIEFSPIPRVDGGFDLIVCAPNDVNNIKKHTITSRTIQKIDCGFYIFVPKGYHLFIETLPEHIEKGLAIQSAVTSGNEQRVCVYAHNLGKEILVFNNGDKIARMYVLCSYNAKLNIKNKSLKG